MWIPKRLHLINFRSFEDQTFLFRNGQTYLVQGENLTDVGMESNGSGKSSLREGICFVHGFPIFADVQTDIIRFGCDVVEVEMEWFNSKSNQTMIINRKLSIGSPAKLTITIDGEDQKKHFATVPKGEAFIIEKLGVSQKDILNYFIISKERFVSFLTSSDTEKEDLINRFSGGYRINGVEDLVQEDVNAEKDILDTLITERDKIQGRIDGYTEDLNNDVPASTINTQDLEQQIADFQEKIGKVDSSITNLTKRKNRVSIIEKTIPLKKQKVKDKITQLKIDDLIKDQKNSEKELEEADSFKQSLNSILSGVIACPNCKFEFNPGEEVDIDESKKVLEELETLISTITTTIEGKKKKVEEKKKEEQNLNRDIQFFNQKAIQAQTIQRLIDSQIKVLSNEKKSYESLSESVQGEIDAIVEQSKVNRTEELSKKIDALRIQFDEQDKKVKEKEEEIYRLEQWVYRFKSFRSYLANQSLSSIQGFANLYLQEMNTNLGLRLDGFKQNQDGSIRKKITPTILRDGMVEGSGSYKKYSGGERCRIDIAPTLACRHLINLASPSGGIDLFMIDEITEGVDSLGIENLAQAINKLGITSMIISHVSHKKVYPNIITVQKVNGVSQFV